MKKLKIIYIFTIILLYISVFVLINKIDNLPKKCSSHYRVGIITCNIKNN